MEADKRDVTTARSTRSYQELESWLPSPLSEGAWLGLTRFQTSDSKGHGVFVGPTLWQFVAMATGQTDSRKDDSSAKGRIQGMGVLYSLGKLSN